MVYRRQAWLLKAPINRNHAFLVHRSQAWLLAAPINQNHAFFVPPLMGGMVLATSKKTKDRKFPLGAYPPWPEGRVWW